MAAPGSSRARWTANSKGLLQPQIVDPFEVTAVPGQEGGSQLQADAGDGQIGHGKWVAPALQVGGHFARPIHRLPGRGLTPGTEAV